MYEDIPHKKDGVHVSEKDRVLAWTKDVADSTADEASRLTARASHLEARHVEREPHGVVVNQIVTTPAVVVTRVRPESTPKDEITTKAVVGTLLGATAGAVVAYAITTSTENPHVVQQKRVAYRTIEAPFTFELIDSDNDNHVRRFSQANSKYSHSVIAAPPLPHPYIDDLISRSEHSHHSSRSIIRNHIEDVTSAPNVTKISVAGSGSFRTSHASSHGKIAQQSDLIPITEVIPAKKVPLPHNHVTSLAIEEREESKADKSLVFPKNSLSQGSTRRLGESGRPKHYGGRKLGNGKDRDHEGSHRSRTSKK